MYFLASAFKSGLCLLLVAMLGTTTTLAERDCSGLQTSIEETLLLLDPLRQNLVSSYPDAPQGKKSFLAGERHCKGHAAIYPNSQNGSLCPGHLVLSHNPDRCPPTIVEVQCNCHRCKEAQGNCQPVTYPRLVWIYKGSSDAPPEEMIYNVSVGCQCVRATEDTYR